MEKYTDGDFLGQDSTEYLVEQLLLRLNEFEKQVRKEIPEITYQPRLIGVDTNSQQGNELTIVYTQIGERDSQNRSYAKIEARFSGAAVQYRSNQIINTMRLCKPASDMLKVGEYLNSPDDICLHLKSNGDMEFASDATIQSAFASAYLLVEWLD